MNIETTQALTPATTEQNNKLKPVDNIPLAQTSSENDADSDINKETITAKEEATPVVIDRENLETMAQKLQDFIGSLNRGLEFSVDDDSGRDVIKVIDKNTGDTVKQYPSEEVLDLVASLSDAAGTFVNMKA